MSLTFKWLASDALSLELYESTDKDTLYDPANLKSTVAPSVTQYVKNDELADITYYFGIKAIYATGSVIGPITQGMRPSDSGLGPISLILGDTKKGVYGAITATAILDKLPTAVDIRAAYTAKAQSVGSGNSATLLTAVTAIAQFRKMMMNGRILFIPYTQNVVQCSSSTSVANMSEIRDVFITGAPIYIDSFGRKYELKLATYEEYCAFMTQATIYTSKNNQLPKDIVVYGQTSWGVSTTAAVATYSITADGSLGYVYSTDVLTKYPGIPPAVTAYPSTYFVYLELIRE